MGGTALKSGSAGFTMIEALVATLLMSFVCAAVVTVIGQWLPAWNRGLTILQRAEITADGLDRLTEDLAAAEFVSVGGINDKPIFDGSELSVVFVRTRLAPNGGPGIEVVRIAESRDDSGPILVRSTAPLPAGTQGESETLEFANPVIVIRAPYRVSFSYAGPDRVWRPAWHGQSQLPRTVRIQVRDSATSELLAVSTSTPVRAEMAPRCSWAINVTDCPGLASQLGNAAVNGAPGIR
jgi:general secretion pathway protein J